MNEQNGLAKQNKIFSIFEKKEKKMKKILLAIIICVISFSSIMSLAFSYKSYKKFENIIVEENDNSDSFSYETLVVSYSSGSLLNCNDTGCGNTTATITNDGDESILFSISFVDVGGNKDFYEYQINDMNQTIRKEAPSVNSLVLKRVQIKPGESKDYKISLNSVDGINHDNYQLRIQINLEEDKNLFLE